MTELIVVLMLSTAQKPQPILCPAWPNDPPWRPMTCYMLSRLGEPWDREPIGGLPQGQPVDEVKW